MKSLFILILIFVTPIGYALDLNFSGGATLRYRDETEKNKFRLALQLKLGLEFNENTQLVVVGRNGVKYNNGYGSLLDFSKKKGDESEDIENILKDFAVRNLYLQSVFDNDLRIQAGSLPTEKTITSSTAFDSQGWIDGLRVSKGFSGTDFRMTAGSLTSHLEPNLFEREFELNYVEVGLNTKIDENLTVYAGYERHNDESFISFAHSQKVSFTDSKSFAFVGEALLNAEDGTVKGSLGFKGDFFQLLTDIKSGVIIDLRTNSTNKDFAVRGMKFTSGFKTSKGNYATIVAKYKGNKKYKLGGLCRYRKNYDDEIDDERFECALSKKF